MLRAVIFDVDGVLVDSKDANVDLYQKLMVKAGYPKPGREKVLKLFHTPLWQTLEVLAETKDETEIKRIADRLSDPDLNSATRAELFRFPQKLEEILAELHNKYPLAIVTSRLKIGMNDIFNLRQIDHLFDVVVTYEDYKNPKPHPEPLLVAAERLGVAPQECVYIGDGESDIEAAIAAGMKSIHLSLKPHKSTNAAIVEFSELTSAVESLL
ncbi:HAD family hydrolase [Candidatus Saccharibacteria bacterium]|nr:HAD family hydrolase [Candidatus Saccharibacteria bacterium]